MSASPTAPRRRKRACPFSRRNVLRFAVCGTACTSYNVFCSASSEIARKTGKTATRGLGTVSVSSSATATTSGGGGSSADDDADTQGGSSSSTTIQGSATLSTTATVSFGGDDDDDGDCGGVYTTGSDNDSDLDTATIGSSTLSSNESNTEDESAEATSYIDILAPSQGDVLDPGGCYTVTWKYVGNDDEDAEVLHIDLYTCGAEKDCAGECGEFSVALCEEEGCFASDGSATVILPEVDSEAAGSYFKIAISTDENSSDMECSGSFTFADTHSTAESSATPSPIEESITSDGALVLTSCEDLGNIPYLLGGDLEVIVKASQIDCANVTTVRLGGGSLTLSSEYQVAFSGVRFEVQSGAELLMNLPSVMFGGITNLTSDGGILNVAAGGEVEATGPISFLSNVIQGAGGAIYNQGAIHLNEGALFAENKCGAGGGGAVWNGPTATLEMGLADFRGNEAEDGGRGGAIWNEGILTFGDSAFFMKNQAHLVESSDDEEGYGGGIYNHGGSVSFDGNVEFSGNEAKAGSAFVNASGGRMVYHSDTSIHENAFQGEEEEGGEAGALLNGAGSSLSFEDSVSLVENRGYNAGALRNAGKVIFEEAVLVHYNEATVDGGGFINAPGAEITFQSDVEFVGNVGTGYGGAVLNHAALTFNGGEGTYVVFEDNYSVEQECQDIQSKDGSDVEGLESIPDLCDIGTQELWA